MVQAEKDYMGGQEIKAVLGKNIKVLRAYRRFSQAGLAERADISIAYLSKIERGIKYPKPDILSQLADGLGVEVHELFKAEPAPGPLPIAAPTDSRKLINRLSKDITRRVVRAMETGFSRYLR